MVVLVVLHPSLLLVEGDAADCLRTRSGHRELGLQADIEDHAPDPDAIGPRRSIKSEQVQGHRLKIQLVGAGPPAVVELEE